MVNRKIALNAHYCSTCNKIIQANNLKRILCTICNRRRHLKCTALDITVKYVICPLCVDELFPFCHLKSDADFYSAIHDNNGKSYIDYQLLNTVKLELNCDFSTSPLTVDDNIDADAI
jgi:hypothetical protein